MIEEEEEEEREGSAQGEEKEEDDAFRGGEGVDIAAVFGGGNIAERV